MLPDAKYAYTHGNIGAAGSMTVEAWHTYRIENVKQQTVKPNTLKSYRERYATNSKEYIGNMLISNAKPMHCQQILNAMNDGDYAGASIEQTKHVMKNMFDCAVDNEII